MDTALTLENLLAAVEANTAAIAEQQHQITELRAEVDRLNGLAE